MLKFILFIVLISATLLAAGCASKKAPANAPREQAPVQGTAQPPANLEAAQEIIIDKSQISLKFKAGVNVCGSEQSLLPPAVTQWVVRVNTVCSPALVAQLRNRGGTDGAGNQFDPSLWVGVELKQDADPDAMLRALKAMPDVEVAEFTATPIT